MSLVELRLQDLAVFVDQVVPFGAGFTVLTGETGSGKSVCVTALRLALGDRPDGDPVRAGAETARVSAVFDDAPAAVRERLSSLGIPGDDLTTLTREISRSGRGSCRINGALVSATVLREVGEALAEITRQGSSARLLQRGRQRDLLDVAAGAVEQREELRVAVAAWRQAVAALEEARRRRDAGAAEIEAAEQLVAQLAHLDLTPEADDLLAAERLRLRSAGALAAASEELRRSVGGDDELPGAADLLARAVDRAAAVSGVDPALDALVDDATQLLERLRELGLAARRHSQAVAVDEARLAEVEERLDVLARVRRRHGSIEEALAELQSARELLDAGQDGGARVAAAEAGALAARDRVAALAERLSDLRRAAARRLEREVEAALGMLELPHARLRVVLERRADPEGVPAGGALVRCGVTGIDEVEFRLATNRAAVPAALDEGVSGGELSRLVLALAACVTETGSPLLVLDEVDAGIGGETAARVGDLLAATGAQRQVLAVTHRAEIASRAGAHVLVSKRDGAAGAVAVAAPVEGDDRLAEIARLMSGRVTEAALARAIELRGEAVATLVAAAPPPGRPASRRRPPAGGRAAARR